MEMLYKKYHRNFVRQFRKGVKVKLSSFGIRTITTEPFIELTLVGRKPYITFEIAKDIRSTLVYCNGRLVIRSVVQKIS